MTNKIKTAGAFILGLSIASSVTFAQLGGRGRNVAFVDGTVISPTSVTASGTADQFVCSSTTATCEVESSASATTMTATVPAFDIGPTATPGANDRLACFSYGATGSKTRVMCVDVEGDVSTPGSYNSTVASGSQAYTCTNTGCRLSLGATARYLVDDGANLEFVAPVQGTSFEATNATASAVLFSGGTSTNALIVSSTSPDSFVTSTQGAIELRASNAVASGDAIMTVRMSDGTDLMRVRTNKQVVSGNFDGRFAGQDFTSFNSPIILQTWMTPASETKPIQLASFTAFTNDNVSLVSISNGGSGTTEVAHFSKDGLLRVNAANAAKPTCNATNRGRIYYSNHGGSGNDVAEICMASGASFAWQPYAFGDANASFTSYTSTVSGSGNAFVAPSNTKVCLDGATCATSLLHSSGSTRAELTSGGSTFVVGTGGVRVTAGTFVADVAIDLPALARFRNTATTIADSGGAGAASHTQSVYNIGVRYTCNDADGCNVTMSEASAIDGYTMTFTNESANTVNFTDTAGVTELAGNFAMGQYDTLTLRYVNDRWVELSRSNN